MKCIACRKEAEQNDSFCPVCMERPLLERVLLLLAYLNSQPKMKGESVCAEKQ